MLLLSFSCKVLRPRLFVEKFAGLPVSLVKSIYMKQKIRVHPQNVHTNKNRESRHDWKLDRAHFRLIACRNGKVCAHPHFINGDKIYKCQRHKRQTFTRPSVRQSIYMWLFWSSFGHGSCICSTLIFLSRIRIVLISTPPSTTRKFNEHFCYY